MYENILTAKKVNLQYVTGFAKAVTNCTFGILRGTNLEY